jgi:hypothetical protein
MSINRYRVPGTPFPSVLFLETPALSWYLELIAVQEDERGVLSVEVGDDMLNG